jgi:hypothetical protein
MAILHVRASLSRQNKAQRFKDTTYLPRLENWGPRHWLSGYHDALGPDELSLENGFSILEKHPDDLSKVTLQFVQRLRLRMSAGETGNETDIQPRIGASLNHSGKHFHGGERIGASF